MHLYFLNIFCMLFIIEGYIRYVISPCFLLGYVGLSFITISRLFHCSSEVLHVCFPRFVVVDVIWNVSIWSLCLNCSANCL